MRRFHLLCFASALVFGCLSHVAPAAETTAPRNVQKVFLWGGEARAESAREEGTTVPSRGGNITRITDVTSPTITVYRAEKTSQPAPAVLICPGGGYKILAVDIEGSEVAEWLNSLGITAVLLKYRVPGNRPGAFEDVQRAMELIRQNAEAWNIDNSHVGIIGFSAGAHLAARLSTSSSGETETLRRRPEFTILIYPAYLAGDEFQLATELNVTSQTPPAFIIQTQDDKSFWRSSVAYYLALQKAGVASELHLFPSGGHGYGLRTTKHAVSGWPTLCATWLEKSGVVKPAK